MGKKYSQLENKKRFKIIICIGKQSMDDDGGGIMECSSLFDCVFKKMQNKISKTHRQTTIKIC